MATKDKQEQTRRVTTLSRYSLALRIVVIVLAVALVGVAIGLTAYYVSRNARTVTITFDTEDEIQPITIGWGEVPQLPILSREGYVFLGWYTQDDVLVNEAYFVDFDYSTDLLLHSVWDIIDPVTVTYDSRGGNEVEPMQVPRGYTGSVAGTTERSGFYLLSWCFDEQCLSMYYPDEYVIEQDVVLYAKWLAKDLNEDVVGTITFNAMGGSDVASATIQLGQPVALSEPRREGYVFVGWYSDKDYTYSVDTDILLTQSCVLYAKWSQRDSTYTVSFVSPDGAPTLSPIEYNYDAYVRGTDIVAPKWAQHRYEGIFEDALFTKAAHFDYYIRENHTYYLSYSSIVDQYISVTYALYNDHSETRQYTPGVTVEDWRPYREGYVFDGWYADIERTQAIDCDTEYVVDGMVVYAKWIAASNYADEYVRYELSSDGTYVVAAGLADQLLQHCVIADTYDGLPVTQIRERAFFGSRLVDVQVGANITAIGNNAFANCNFLTALSLPVSVTDIDHEAFASCVGLQTVTIAGRAYIGDDAFRGCTALQQVDARQVVSISSRAFRDCTALQQVDIIYVQRMGVQAFYNCSALQQISLSNGVLDAIPTECFYGCKSLKSIDLPSTVKTVNYLAFAYSGLTIFDTKGIERIYSTAFECAAALAQFKIRAALISLDTMAISQAISLLAFEVDAANAKYSAVNGALCNKAGTELLVYAGGADCTIGDSIESINVAAFLGAKQVVNINVDPNNAYYCSVDGVLYSKDKKTLVCYPSGRSDAEYTVADTVETIYSGAFAYCNALQSVTLPASVQSVAQGGFYSLPALTTINCLGDVDIQDGFSVYLCPNVTIVYPEDEESE